ncbi:efflux RND transporter periplasmic adaptor subunit [Flavobacterium sp. MAH-1]|uniref:Efflux RND transporter periplasmic adaptor subunit n=1 Tax=Flavobacterium agri TaxID=2743471 RepID=A0A7Y9C5Z8_9FLAO|nr:efflux RND transporter periplasmic adaptor subunit [Flavobacterium agri]NUY81481.1 efflux RND transporter periplasmic adaptor subunit [Flavobacterium agri]NYA71505.1 efflux RND transporter periplasmic adaptor subunit [Flavobacterium agri]
MKNNNIIFALFLALAVGCSPKEEIKPAVEAAPALETVALTKEKLSTEMRVPAELTGMKQVDLYAKVTSFVKELKVDIGSEVTQGQLLVVLEAPEISSQLSAAESRLKSQEAVYLASKSTYNRLFETSKVEGTISKNDLEQAEARKNSDFAQYQAAKASYAEVSNIRGYLQIRAPFTGVVSARNVNLGAYVGPTGKGSDLPLLTIQQQDKLRLSVFVPEQYSGYLKDGDALSFNVKSLPGQKFDAKIARMSGALDARLRSERVEMDVVNSKKNLKPGMIAEVLLPLNAPDSTIVVPKSAVVTSSEGVYVLLVDNGVTKRVPVTKGRELEDRIEVFGELPENGNVVKIASEEIKDGTPVQISSANKQ